jgi:hypothetical protein
MSRTRNGASLVFVTAFVILWMAAAAAGPPIPQSLFCQIFNDEGNGFVSGPLQMWAEGNSGHAVMLAEGHFIHVLQLGDVMYTWGDLGLNGISHKLGDGLASYGLIRQIERVRSLGSWVKDVEVEGTRYDVYYYSGTAHDGGGRQYYEEVTATFDSRTGAPKTWVSTIRGGSAGDSSTMNMYFRDVQVNARMPIDIFKLPGEIQFEPKE